jgi:acylphosphatase
MDVRGFVRNLPNGQVELIGEGNTGSLEALIREIQAAMADGIQNVDIKKSPSPAEFSSFEVRF